MVKFVFPQQLYETTYFQINKHLCSSKYTNRLRENVGSADLFQMPKKNAKNKQHNQLLD